MSAKVQFRIPSALRGQIDPMRLRRAALSALALGGETSDSELTVVLVDDAHMIDLNRAFRGRNSTTDVLAFEFDDETGSSEGEDLLYLGDVIISHERALEQASDLGHDLQQELEVLVVHGVLHLLSFDDETSEARSRMWEAQEEALAKLEAE